MVVFMKITNGFLLFRWHFPNGCYLHRNCNWNLGHRCLQYILGLHSYSGMYCLLPNCIWKSTVFNWFKKSSVWSWLHLPDSSSLLGTFTIECSSFSVPGTISISPSSSFARVVAGTSSSPSTCCIPLLSTIGRNWKYFRYWD